MNVAVIMEEVAVGRFLFSFAIKRSCDIGSLYINEHAEKEDSQYVHWRSMQDNEISALIQVLSSSEPIESITDEERKLI